MLQSSPEQLEQLGQRQHAMRLDAGSNWIFIQPFPEARKRKLDQVESAQCRFGCEKIAQVENIKRRLHIPDKRWELISCVSYNHD